MKEYTKKEYEEALAYAKNDFKNFQDQIIENYTIYLDNLIAEENHHYKSKLHLGNQKREIFESEIFEFIHNKYPKTEEYTINGLVFFTVDTMINFELLTESSETRKEIEDLYRKFMKEIYLGLN